MGFNWISGSFFIIFNSKTSRTNISARKRRTTILTLIADVKIGDYFGFGDITSLGEGTSKLVPFIFSAAAFLVIFYFLMGAFQYLRAGGNKEEVEKGRQMITHSFIGFILLMLAFLVIQYVLTGFFGEGAAGIVNIFKK